MAPGSQGARRGNSRCNLTDEQCSQRGWIGGTDSAVICGGPLVKHRKKLIAAAVLFGVPFTYWLVSYHPAAFQGAGPLEDTGFFSYPRYHAPVGAVPLATPGDHSFRFSGLPSEIFALMFYLPGRTYKDREAIANLATSLTAVILDKSGTVI